MPSGTHLFITDLVDTGEPIQQSVERAGLESLGNGWDSDTRTHPRAFSRDLIWWHRVWIFRRAGFPTIRTARFPHPTSWKNISAYSWPGSA